jgi:uncharacterized pyridoxamine 5'-phosphate oxidase family protein
MPSFPTYILKDTDYVLDLFCAHFGGSNTLQQVDKFIKEYTGVDIDNEKLREMRQTFKGNKYLFVCADVYKDLYDRMDHYYDIVISDQWTNQNDQVYSLLSELFRISSRYVVISTNEEYHKKLPFELNGFHLESFWWRSEYLNGTYWAVYKRVK